MSLVTRHAARGQLAWLLVAVVLSMSPWFSATVVASAMITEWGESSRHGIWLTLGVQLGFVIGSTVSAILLLSDRWRPARLAMWSAWLAAVATATLILPTTHVGGAIVLRVIVGIALAGVYPPSIKLLLVGHPRAADWPSARWLGEPL